MFVNISNFIQDLSRSVDTWAVVKKVRFVSVSLPQSHNGFRVS